MIIIILLLSQFYVSRFLSSLCCWYFLDSKVHHATLSIQNLFDNLCCSQQESFLHEVAIVVYVHTTWFQLDVHVSCISPKEQPCQLYQFVISSTTFVLAFYIQQPHGWLISGEAPSELLSMLIVVSTYSCAAINIPSVPSSAFLFFAKFLGSSPRLFSSWIVDVITFL